MPARKSKAQKRQAERKLQLRLETAARHAASSAPSTPSSSSNPGKQPQVDMLTSSPSRRATQTASGGSVASTCSSGVSTRGVAKLHRGGLAFGMC